MYLINLMVSLDPMLFALSNQTRLVVVVVVVVLFSQDFLRIMACLTRLFWVSAGNLFMKFMMVNSL